MYLSFTNGICRITRANDVEAAKQEAIQATEATGVACKLLANDLSMIGGTSFCGNGRIEFIDNNHPHPPVRVG